MSAYKQGDLDKSHDKKKTVWVDEGVSLSADVDVREEMGVS